MSKRKKIMITGVIVIIAIIGIVAYKLYLDNSYRNFKDIVKVDYSTIDKIIISSGTTGKQFEVKDKEEILKYLGKFDNIKLKKDKNQYIAPGFCIETRLFSGETKKLGFSYGFKEVCINNTRYVSNTNIDSEQIHRIEEEYNLD